VGVPVVACMRNSGDCERNCQPLIMIVTSASVLSPSMCSSWLWWGALAAESPKLVLPLTRMQLILRAHSVNLA
jgi:hypothetical protein